MNELSLHILDIVENSIAAGAAMVFIDIAVADGVLTISVRDDGCGMDEALAERVTSPFATTRTTRKVGLGIPMFKQSAEMSGGSFTLVSELGIGTELTARFCATHIDCPPMGNLTETVVALVVAAPEKPDLCMTVSGGEVFAFDTREIKAVLGGVPLTSPDVLNWIKEYVKEGIESTGAAF